MSRDFETVLRCVVVKLDKTLHHGGLSQGATSGLEQARRQLAMLVRDSRDRASTALALSSAADTIARSRIADGQLLEDLYDLMDHVELRPTA